MAAPHQSGNGEGDPGDRGHGESAVGTVHFHIHYADRLWRWRLMAGPERVVAEGGRGYASKSECLAAINLVMETSRRTLIYEA
jgi:uncharacterized protein YegP (UPF0339 family)